MSLDKMIPSLLFNPLVNIVTLTFAASVHSIVLDLRAQKVTFLCYTRVFKDKVINISVQTHI